MLPSADGLTPRGGIGDRAKNGEQAIRLLSHQRDLPPMIVPTVRRHGPASSRGREARRLGVGISTIWPRPLLSIAISPQDGHGPVEFGAEPENRVRSAPGSVMGPGEAAHRSRSESGHDRAPGCGQCHVVWNAPENPRSLDGRTRRVDPRDARPVKAQSGKEALPRERQRRHRSAPSAVLSTARRAISRPRSNPGSNTQYGKRMTFQQTRTSPCFGSCRDSAVIHRQEGAAPGR